MAKNNGTRAKILTLPFWGRKNIPVKSERKSDGRTEQLEKISG